MRGARDVVRAAHPGAVTEIPAGPLAPLLALPGVTDVLVQAPDAAWVDRGRGLERNAVDCGGVDGVRALAVALAASAGRRLDDAEPTVDARLADGTRLHAVLPPVADGCTAISLRRIRAEPFTPEDLIVGGMLTREVAALLAALVRARVPVLVSGGTGAGKTTLLATLLALADPGERIVLIEEAGELALGHPHVVRLVERRPNVEGAGGVPLARLVREALRMRPDRIVLGECRGAELREVLAAANTGHRGALTTVHANSARDVPARLEALALLAGLTSGQLAAQAAAAFAVVVHVERDPTGRRVAEVARIRVDGGGLAIVTAYERDGTGERYGPGWPGLRALAEGVAA
ncbi:TadA family conjugal transfer-associated ATPase [Demequina maris]|uniref:TadA family conjugal transfer-associated ATPase n=1 Tax=Demequina maris TaxID=1638982 RepID=UPI0007810585|nr:TadA family conjugal transfer-associated ATPase [Demequina maris]